MRLRPRLPRTRRAARPRPALPLASVARRARAVAASISGTGALTFSATPTADECIFNLTGDFSEYEGTIAFNRGSKTKALTVNPASVKAFGKNPSEVEEQGFSLCSAMTLNIADDCAVAQVNRGLYVADDATISVADGKTFSWAGPLSFADGKTLSKTGEGTLVLGGANTAAGTLTVSAGKVVAGNPYALRNLTVDATSAAKVYLPSVEESEAVNNKIAERDYLFVPSGTYDSSKTPAENLSALGLQIPENYGLGSKWTATLTQTEVTDESGSVVGAMIRLSAKRGGLAIIVR